MIAMISKLTTAIVISAGPSAVPIAREAIAMAANHSLTSTPFFFNGHPLVGDVHDLLL